MGTGRGAHQFLLPLSNKAVRFVGHCVFGSNTPDGYCGMGKYRVNVMGVESGVLCVDPRPDRPAEPSFELADRVSRAELRSNPVLLFDNGKLASGEYMAVYDAVENHLADEGVQETEYVEETIRGKTATDFESLAESFNQGGYVAALTALGDKGMTIGTVGLTIELERVGIPTVCLTAPPGSRLAEATAWLRVGGLRLCEIDMYQASSASDIRDEIAQKFSAIIAGLTTNTPPEPANAVSDIDDPPPEDSLRIPIAQSDVDPGELLDETMEQFEARDLGDGLPIIPPTEQRVQEMLEHSTRDPDYVFARNIGPAAADIAVRDVALGAVMAGCKPPYLPIISTAFEAITDDRFNFLQSVTTSNPSGNLLIISGPLAEDLGVHGGQGCLGPGFRANATIGRAVNLVLINTCRAIPGKADLDCLASPVEYTYCFAENRDRSPWPTINQEQYDAGTTTVYALKGESPTNVLDFLSRTPENLLTAISDAACHLGSNNCYITGPLLVILVPDHAKLLASHDWDKQAIREYIHEQSRMDAATLTGHGINPVRPPEFDGLESIPVTESPSDIEVVVAGGPGGHSAVVRPWAMYSDAIVKPVVDQSGHPLTEITP